MILDFFFQKMFLQSNSLIMAGLACFLVLGGCEAQTPNNQKKHVTSFVDSSGEQNIKTTLTEGIGAYVQYSEEAKSLQSFDEHGEIINMEIRKLGKETICLFLLSALNRSARVRTCGRCSGRREGGGIRRVSRSGRAAAREAHRGFSRAS